MVVLVIRAALGIEIAQTRRGHAESPLCSEVDAY